MSARLAANWWLWAIVLLGAALRLFPIWFGLPYLHARPDESVAIGHALRILEGEPNPGFFHWPSLTFYLFAALFTVASWIRHALSIESPITPAGYLLLARGCVAIAGTITIAAVFALGRRIDGRTTGLLAALFLAAAILHVRDSHFAMTDVLMTLLVVVSLSLVVRATDAACDRSSDPGAANRWFAAAGFCGGLAASTKYNAAAVAAAMGAAQLWLLTRPGTPRWAFTAWIPTLTYLLAFAAGFLVATPYALLDMATFEKDVRFTLDHLSRGHGVDLGTGWTYHLMRSLPYGVGIPTFVAAIAGVVPFVRFHPRYAAILGSFAIALYASLGPGRTVFFRYILPLVPLVCLLAAVAVRRLAPWLAARVGVPPRAVAALLAAAVVIPSAVNCVWFDVLLARTDTRVLAAQWLAEHLDPDDSLHDAGGAYSELDLTGIRFHQWYFDAGTGSFGHPEGRTPDWLVFRESPLREYARVPWPLRQLAREHYTLVVIFAATRGRAMSAVYDHQDAFFLPVSHFHTVERPGPTVSIYRRAAPVAGLTGLRRTALPSRRGAAPD